MSKTYRKRKGNPYWWSKEEFEQERKEYLEGNNKYWRWYYKKSYEAELAHYHSDSGSFMNSTKMYYYNDSWRQQVRQALKRELQAIEKGEVIFPDRKQFMDYYW